jgi:hypothetical protein
MMKTKTKVINYSGAADIDIPHNPTKRHLSPNSMSQYLSRLVFSEIWGVWTFGFGVSWRCGVVVARECRREWKRD